MNSENSIIMSVSPCSYYETILYSGCRFIAELRAFDSFPVMPAEIAFRDSIAIAKTYSAIPVQSGPPRYI